MKFYSDKYRQLYSLPRSKPTYFMKSQNLSIEEKSSIKQFIFQRTIQDLFEVEAGSGEKVEEFVVLHQEPSASEAISPRVARPYIQALHSIMDAQEEEEQQLQQGKDDEASVESTGKEEEQDGETSNHEEPAHIEELNAVMEQVTFFAFKIMVVFFEFFFFSLMLKIICQNCSSHPLRDTLCITSSTSTSAMMKLQSR